MLPFVAVNLWGYIDARNCCKGDTVTDAGFPFVFYTTSWLIGSRQVMWDGVIADALFAIGVSAISARILQSVFQPAV